MMNPKAVLLSALLVALAYDAVPLGKDRAEFLLVYIREAHPSDGWQMPANRGGGMGPFKFSPAECEAFLKEHLAEPENCKEPGKPEKP